MTKPPTRRAALAALASAGAAAGGLLPAVAAACEPHPDQTLLDLAPQYDAALAAENRALAMQSALLDDLEAALLAAKPAALQVREEDFTLFRFVRTPIWTSMMAELDVGDDYDGDIVDALREQRRTRPVFHLVDIATGARTEVPSEHVEFDIKTTELHGSSVPYPEAQTRADEIVAAWDCFAEATRSLRGASGVDDATDVYEAAVDARQAVGAKITACRATTLDGLRVRAKIVASIYEEDDLEPEEEHTTAETMLWATIRDLAAL